MTFSEIPIGTRFRVVDRYCRARLAYDWPWRGDVWIKIVATKNGAYPKLEANCEREAHRGTGVLVPGDDDWAWCNSYYEVEVA